MGTYITKMMTQNRDESKNRYVLCSISNKYGAVWDWPLHRNCDDYQSADYEKRMWAVHDSIWLVPAVLITERETTQDIFAQRKQTVKSCC